MNKKNKQFFGTNISEEDMKDSGLFISNNTEAIPMDKYGHIHEDEYHVPGPTERMINDMFADWEKQKSNRDKKWNKWDILHEKKAKNNALLGMFLGFFGLVFNYITAVNAFSALDSSYADSANLFIGVSAVGFAAFAGYIAHTLITSTFDWFTARRNLIELGG
jgi:hypothetical protein